MGCEFPEDLFYAWGGRPTADIIVALNEQQGLAMPVAAVVERREGYYQELLPQLAAVPDVLAHIHDAHRRVPFAVVSGSTRASVTASLEALGLLDRFDVLVCADDYTGPSPTRRRSCSRRSSSAYPGVLPGLRGHRPGHPGRDRGRHGIGTRAATARRLRSQATVSRSLPA
ncbi:HAD hydrolase-like protein [Micromonospora sp. M12]